jgi:hypothetical protein
MICETFWQHNLESVLFVLLTAIVVGLLSHRSGYKAGMRYRTYVRTLPDPSGSVAQHSTNDSN